MLTVGLQIVSLASSTALVAFMDHLTPKHNGEIPYINIISITFPWSWCQRETRSTNDFYSLKDTQSIQEHKYQSPNARIFFIIFQRCVRGQNITTPNNTLVTIQWKSPEFYHTFAFVWSLQAMGSTFFTHGTQTCGFFRHQATRSSLPLPARSKAPRAEL